MEQSNIITTIPLIDLNTTFVITPWLDFIHTIMENYTLLEDNPITILDEIYLRKLNLLLVETPRR